MTRSIITSTRQVERFSPRVSELLTMLTYRRPSGSKEERAFIDRFLKPLGVLPDEYGNQWLTVGNDSPILWSSHTDTVHTSGGKQKVLYGAGFASVEDSNCLGADCTVGVWLMINMIRAGVPGTYVFHVDEEVGGRGSDYIATTTPERLAGFQFAIAFDRKGYNEIITHQFGGRTASDAFAKSLAEVLKPLRYQPSNGGTFTDTANYCEIIPECTNIGVGYFNQHSGSESLDIGFSERLLDQLLIADMSRLTCSRTPHLDDYDDLLTGSHGDMWMKEFRSPYSLESYVKQYPREAAAFLETLGYDQNDLESWVWNQYNQRYNSFE